MVSYRNLPKKWIEREKLREKGQFWTPEWVTRAMVSYVIEDSSLVFDPAFGEGAFYSAVKAINQSKERSIKFYGIDIDPQLIERAKEELSADPYIYIEVRDFIEDPPKRLFKSIVANPPYIRHHRLSEQAKKKLKEICLRILGETLDSRAGIHIYFLIQALALLDHNGRLAFIMPADTCEGKFATQLWRWITKNYCLESVITFELEATPFPGVDVNPIIFLVKKAQPQKSIIWVKVLKSETQDLESFVLSKFGLKGVNSLKVMERDLNEALTIGLSREPTSLTASGHPLLQFAKVMRGVATGANRFFLLTREEANKRRIPAEFLKPVISKVRDVDGFQITNETIKKLEQNGKPTLLFAPDGRRIDDFPIEVQRYLKEGEEKGLPSKPLISSRNPWYKMEERKPPPLIFAYLGRRNCRFILNKAGVIPLTCFLCVYPYDGSPSHVKRLWQALTHPSTLSALPMVAKSYGGGALKVEPRMLEQLIIPASVLEEIDLLY